MDLVFDDEDLQTIAESKDKSERAYGPSAEALRQRLCELAAADTLRIAMSVPTLGIKEVSATGGFDLQVSAELRVVVQVDDRSVRKEGGGVDFQNATRLHVLAIEKKA